MYRDAPKMFFSLFRRNTDVIFTNFNGFNTVCYFLPGLWHNQVTTRTITFSKFFCQTQARSHPHLGTNDFLWGGTFVTNDFWEGANNNFGEQLLTLLCIS